MTDLVVTRDGVIDQSTNFRFDNSKLIAGLLPKSPRVLAIEFVFVRRPDATKPEYCKNKEPTHFQRLSRAFLEVINAGQAQAGPAPSVTAPKSRPVHPRWL